MRSLVIYDSETGNTKKIANAIFEAIPSADKDIKNIQEIDPASLPEYDNYFVGYWLRKGSCSIDLIKFLGSLHHKNVALFGTCGIPQDKSGREAITQRISVWLPDDNTFLGSFLCQGRMPISVRNCCEELRAKIGDLECQKILDAFDEALLHPDTKDLDNASHFAKEMLEKTVIAL